MSAKTARRIDQAVVNNHGAFIWRIANLLRGTYKPAQYGSVILPFVVLRRLDCLLADTKEAVLAKAVESHGLPADIVLPRVAKQHFWNTSRYDLKKIVVEPAGIRANIGDYVRGSSPNVRDIFEQFELDKTLAKLDSSDLLFLVTQRSTQRSWATYRSRCRTREAYTVDRSIRPRCCPDRHAHRRGKGTHSPPQGAAGGADHRRGDRANRCPRQGQRSVRVIVIEP